MGDDNLYSLSLRPFHGVKRRNSKKMENIAFLIGIPPAEILDIHPDFPKCPRRFLDLNLVSTAGKRKRLVVVEEEFHGEKRKAER